MATRHIQSVMNGPNGARFRFAAAQSLPSPGPGDIVVAVEHALLDIDKRNGKPLPGGIPVCWGGVVGTVVELGDRVDRFREGDRVAGFGAIAERALCPARVFFRIPAEPSNLEPALLPLCLLAIHAVDRIAPADGPGLVSGLGGFGSLVALGMRQAGCRTVVGVTGNEERLRLGQALGLDRVEAPRWRDWAEGGNRAPVLVPAVAVETTGDPQAIIGLLYMITRMGRIALARPSGGHTAEVDFYSTIHRRGLVVSGIQDPWAEHWPMAGQGVETTAERLRRAADLAGLARTIPGLLSQAAVPARDVEKWRGFEPLLRVRFT